MANNFAFKDNIDIILDKLYAATEASAEQMARLGVEAVQNQILYGYKDPHGKDGHTEIVDTGALFDSIKGETKRVSGNVYTVTVGTNLPYAGHVHNGTRKLKARRFITDGIMNAREEMKEVITDEMKNA